MFLNFLKNSSLYLLVLLIERSIIFIITPYLINEIPIVDFGTYSLFLTYESALMPLVTLNLYSAISKEFYEDEYDFKERTFLLLLSYIILSIISILITIVIYFFVPFLLPFSIDASIIAVLTGLLSSFLIYFQTYFKLKNKIFIYSVLSISQSLLYFGIIFLATNYLYSDIKILFYSRMFLFFGILTILFYFTKSLHFSTNFQLIVSSLKLTLPTVIFSFSAFLFVMADRFFISKYLGKAALGEYAAVYQIPALISLITGAFSTAWIPWLYENLKYADHSKHIYLVKVIYLLLATLIIGSIVFFFLIPYLGSILFNKTINFNSDYIIFIVLGFLFQGIYNLVSPLVFYSGKTKYHAYIGVIVSVISILINFQLIPILGLKGASITFCLSWFLLALLFFIATFYSYKMPWFYFYNKSIRL
jgi:O-antigen/teichoic acid export membrane protein